MTTFKRFKEPRQLVIHRDGTFDFHGRWGTGKPKFQRQWQLGCREISPKDFNRLEPRDQARLRRLEKRRGVKLVVNDNYWEPGV
jgi:hypothetical protein